MLDETTNPDAPSLRSVYKAVKEMREENRDDHKTITETLNAHSVQLACLETKWGTLWKLVKWVVAPVMGIAIGAAGVVSLLL